MAKKLELKFLTSANTELIVSIADPKDGLALAAVQAEAAKIMPVLANGKGIGAASFAKAVIVTTTEDGNSLILKENYKEKYIEKERRDNDGSFQICGKDKASGTC